VGREETSSERRERDEKRTQSTEEVTVVTTWRELDEVARKIGIEDGRVLYAMLAKPTASASVDDYVACVSFCDGKFHGNNDALVACIEGCATASKGSLKDEDGEIGEQLSAF
jgi:hypothetical protein